MNDKLGKKAGHETDELNCDGSHPTTIVPTPPPVWFKPELIWKSLDAIPMLAAGEHPKSLVLRDLKTMPKGMIYELVTPFVPAPLIDAVCATGYQSWTREDPQRTFRTYFVRA